MNPIRTDCSEAAHSVVARIVVDLTDRRGLRQEWEHIDEDIQDEIIQAWTSIAYREIHDLVGKL